MHHVPAFNFGAERGESVILAHLEHGEGLDSGDIGRDSGDISPPPQWGQSLWCDIDRDSFTFIPTLYPDNSSLLGIVDPHWVPSSPLENVVPS